METSTKDRIAIISLIMYVILLILSGFLASAPGDRVGFYCVTGVFAVPPMKAGSRRYRLLGTAALIIAASAAAIDYRAGQKSLDILTEKTKQRIDDARP